MKKFSMISLSLSMAIALFACGNDSASNAPMPKTATPALETSAGVDKSSPSSVANIPSSTTPESPSSDVISQPLSSSNDTPAIGESDEYKYKFEPPSVEHSRAEEMLDIVQGFGNEFMFLEFDNIQDLPYKDKAVSSNLFRLTTWRNERLVACGTGVTEEDYLSVDTNVLQSSRIVRYDDMNMLGKRCFGDSFSFPRFLDCDEITPIENTDFYGFKIARSGMDVAKYFLTHVLEQGDSIIATFLPCTPLLSWDDNSIPDISFIDTHGGGFDFSYDLSKQIYPDGIAKEYPECYDYCYLSVPQEELGTIAVTLKEASDGRLIATSCRYNRKSAQ